MFPSQRPFFRLALVAIFVFALVEYVNGLAMEYCSTLNTGTGNGSRSPYLVDDFRNVPILIVISSQTLQSTNPMVCATISASMSMHLLWCKEIIAGARIMCLELQRRPATAKTNVRVTRAILVVETIHMDTCH